MLPPKFAGIGSMGDNMGETILQMQIPELMIQHASKTIVAACGCFDIFHIGHLDYLEGAKLLGDILIVGINSDQSILKNKGRAPVKIYLCHFYGTKLK